MGLCQLPVNTKTSPNAARNRGKGHRSPARPSDTRGDAFINLLCRPRGTMWSRSQTSPSCFLGLAGDAGCGSGLIRSPWATRAVTHLEATGPARGGRQPGRQEEEGNRLPTPLWASREEGAGALLLRGHPAPAPLTCVGALRTQRRPRCDRASGRPAVSAAAVSRAPTSAPFNRAPPRLCPDAPGRTERRACGGQHGPAPGSGRRTGLPGGAGREDGLEGARGTGRAPPLRGAECTGRAGPSLSPPSGSRGCRTGPP